MRNNRKKDVFSATFCNDLIKGQRNNRHQRFHRLLPQTMRKIFIVHVENLVDTHFCKRKCWQQTPQNGTKLPTHWNNEYSYSHFWAFTNTLKVFFWKLSKVKYFAFTKYIRLFSSSLQMHFCLSCIAIPTCTKQHWGIPCKSTWRLNNTTRNNFSIA